ncbi:hypothetical protein PIB30_105988, partial [Stylosanthes scabra]|nr:hypothetical protein [Stylosanthes scabra]
NTKDKNLNQNNIPSLSNIDTWLRTKAVRWLNDGEHGSFGSEHIADEGGSSLELGGMWVMGGRQARRGLPAVRNGAGEMVVGLGGAEGEVGGRWRLGLWICKMR